MLREMLSQRTNKTKEPSWSLYIGPSALPPVTLTHLGTAPAFGAFAIFSQAPLFRGSAPSSRFQEGALVSNGHYNKWSLTAWLTKQKAVTILKVVTKNQRVIRTCSPCHSACVCVCVHTFPSFYKYTSYIDLRASLQDGPILTKAALRKGFLNPRPSPTGHNILINAVTALRHELCR